MEKITKRAVLLVTVYRRYHELRKNLERTRLKALAELGYMPDVVLVWASPEVGRLWFIQELQRDGLITHLLKRPGVDGLDGIRPTTFSESINLRLGLNFIKQHYDNATHYVIMHAADIFLQDCTLTFVDDRINGRIEEGPHNAVVFFWQNGVTNSDTWATYFFAVCLDPAYWPPVSSDGDQDVLERQWGLLLQRTQPPAVFKWHNAHERRYLHRHESESLPSIEFKPQNEQRCLPMACSGYKSWLARLWDVFAWLFGTLFSTKPSKPKDS